MNKSAFNLHKVSDLHLTAAESLLSPKFDQFRDDASAYNRRQRSNSMSSLYHQANAASNSGNIVHNLVVPSPTTADYLRNRTRENFNVINGNNVKQ